MKQTLLYALPILKFPAKFAVWFSFVAIGSLFAISPDPFKAITGIVVLGLMFAHGVELQHEALHGVAFKNRRLNYVIGFILGLPMLISLRHYRGKHLHHHRHLGRPTDKEILNYKTNDRITLGGFIFDFFGIRRLSVAGSYIAASMGMTNKNDDEFFDKAAKHEYLLIFALLALLSGISAAYFPTFVLRVWILPLLLVAEPAHFMIEIPEHLFCDRSTPEFYKNTRIIRGSWFSFWYTNGNNLHAEHHKKASLPVERLPEEFLKNTEEMYAHFDFTYPQFYGKLFSSMSRKESE